MPERIKFSCSVCGGKHPDSYHAEGQKNPEKRERNAAYPIEDVALSIAGEPLLISGLRKGARSDSRGASARRYRTRDGVVARVDENRWLGETGKEVGYDQLINADRMSERFRVAGSINKLLETRFPESYDLLEIRGWNYTGKPDEVPVNTHLRVLYEKLLQRLKGLPIQQLRALEPQGLTRSLKRARSELLAEITSHFPQMITGIGAGHKAQKGRDVYLMASFLAGKPLTSHRLAEKLDSLFADRKILILGDDLGSLSEILRGFGADAWGIEHNPLLLQFARSGIFSENCKPQNQVIAGDIRYLAHSDTQLFKKVLSNGPFDMIYSEYVLYRQDWKQLFLSLDSLLAPGGLNLHAVGDQKAVTSCDEAKTLLYDIAAVAGNDFLKKWTEEQYAHIRDNYAANDILIALRAGIEKEACALVGKISGTHRTESDWYRGKK